MEIRDFTWADMPGMIEVTNAANRADGDPTLVKLDVVEPYWHKVIPSPEKTCVLAVENGQVVAFASTRQMGDLEPERGLGSGRVDPDYRRLGLGTALIEEADARYLAWVAPQIAPEKPITIQRFVLAEISGAVACLDKLGYAYKRSFYDMRIDWRDGDVLPEPVFPHSIELRPFMPERDGRLVFEGEKEAFADHWDTWGSGTFEQFRTEYMEDPHFDPDMWLIAWDGDQIVGAAISEIATHLEPACGYVMFLFVRRPWRKRGLATAILHQTFAVFQQREFNAVELTVDADSLTNAVALYERAGMRQVQERQSFVRTLRG